jgi:hypothetical protein
MKVVKTLVQVGLLLILVFFIYAMLNTDSKSSGSQQYKHVGDEGYLHSSSTNVIVPITQTDLDRAIQLGVANDDIGIAEMVARGRALIVDQNTKVKVIQTTTATAEVRILTGSFTGRSGWVPKEFIK